MAEFLSYVGAYAWVENLVPRPPEQKVTLPDGRVVSVRPNQGGFVHAPSMAHAATGAVLRSAQMTHQNESAESRYRYALDLTSGRVRAARELLDGVRQGQPIGALLGYRFERALHDRALERFIDPFRKTYPLTANKSGDTDPETSTTTDAIPPRDVVDGLVVRTDWRALQDGTGQGPLSRIQVNPAPSNTERSGLEATFAELDEAVDGVADLLTAEGVFQITRGNVAAASVPLDALASGTHPPDPEIARTPRGGIPITHRVLWCSNQKAVHPLWAGVSTPTARAIASPVLDRWVGELLGDPRMVKCWTSPDAGASVIEVSLAQLGLRPLDILELARAAIQAPKELERRILDAAYGGSPPQAATIRFEPSSSDTFDPRTMSTFPELLETARQVSTMFAQVRPLATRDFALLAGGSAEVDPGLITTELGAAGDALLAASGALQTLAAALPTGDSAAIRNALRQAAELQSEAFPVASAGPALVELATSVAGELTKRVQLATGALAKADPSSDPTIPGPTPEDKLAAAAATLKAVFGESFVRLPMFRLPDATRAELGNIADRTATLLGSDADAPSRLVQQMARVRPGMAAWRKVWLFAQAIVRQSSGGLPSRTRPIVEVAQIPYDPSESWVGGTLSAGSRPAGSRLSLVLHRNPVDDALDLHDSMAGLVIDEWTELVPNAEEQTGVAFHHDSPGAEAAQTILLAVPPDPNSATWSFAQLVASVRETLELAKIRAVEPEALAEWGQILPATYLTANTRMEALTGPPETIATRADDVSTRFDTLVAGERRIE